MRPRLAVVKPLTRLTIAADRSEAEKVVQAAAIDADRNDVAAFEDRPERQFTIAGLIPEVGSSPAVVAKPVADFDIQMLRDEALSGLAVLRLPGVDLGELAADPVCLHRAP